MVSEIIFGTLEENFQNALKCIKNIDCGHEVCFDWLLMKEELYTDKRWLHIVQTYSKAYVTIKRGKMLLDILALFQEYDLAQGSHESAYNALKEVGTCVTSLANFYRQSVS